MNDQELEKLAEETIIIGSGVYKYDYQNILQALRIVRDAQEEKLRIAREGQLEEKLKVAKNSLGYAKYHLENGRVSSAIYFVDEALERMGGE